jgi:hypothetical protein
MNFPVLGFYRLTGPVFMAGIILACSQVFSAPQDTESAIPLGKRAPFNVPLAKISVAMDETTNDLKNVRISYEGSNDYVVITPYDDERIRLTAEGREKEVLREQPELAYFTSDFESDELHKVTHTFISTLQIFENDLRHERWDRCLYLDSYLPRFLRGYYYLCDAIREFREPLPRNARIPESAFDVSLNSPKSDERINMWKNDKDYVIKLRIVAKELTFQLKQWESKDRKKIKNSPELFLDTKVKEAFGLFIHVYFNIKPPPKINFHRGRHL